MKRLFLMVIFCLLALPTQAAIVTRDIEYRSGDVTMKGVLTYDDARTGKRPGVLVVHEWWGLNEFARSQARRLAEMGYVALAADMYGGQKTTSDPKEAAALAGGVKQSGEARKRARAALDALAAQPQADPERLAAIGFCFGGYVALELAYSGAPLKAAVSFHGSLPALNAEEGPGLQASLLVLHGADDTFVKPEEIAAFTEGVRQAKADWQMIYYGGAVHSFTNPDADQAGMPGVGYNANAASRSWQAMQTLFTEVFKP